jgi:hypothetical protein
MNFSVVDGEIFIHRNVAATGPDNGCFAIVRIFSSSRDSSSTLSFLLGSRYPSRYPYATICWYAAVAVDPALAAFLVALEFAISRFFLQV